MEPMVLTRAVLTLGLLLTALALVPYRQSRSLEALSELEDLRRQASEARAEQVDMERNIQRLESRSRVVPEARARLGMHTPDATELVILPGEITP